MMIKLLALGFVGMFAALSAEVQSSAVVRDPPACHSNDDFMTWLMGHQRRNPKFYSSSAYWSRVGFTRADTNRIQPVQDDSLCRLAALTINRDMHKPDSTSRHIYMLTEGSYYLALDPALLGGEFHTGYLLDSTLTKVVERLAL
jgi:hypothetical protein